MHKEEFPPLLPSGLYEMSATDLRSMCVANFPLSKTRETIMIGLEKLVGELSRYNIPGSLWVDGSFLTEKVNPEDVDVVLWTDYEVYDTGTADQKGLIDRMDSSQLTPTLRCDSYVTLEYPEGHICHPLNAPSRDYWMDQFGTSAAGDVEKGIVVVGIA